MTRETKLGIGIGGTFLAIAGSWLGVKLYRGEPAATEEPAAIVAENTEEPKPQSLVDASATATPAAETAPQPSPTPVANTEAPAPAAIKPDTDAVVQSTSTSTPMPATPVAPAGDPPPPVIPVQTQPTEQQPVAAPIIPAPIVPAPMTDPMPTPVAPAAPAPAAPAPVVEPPPPVVAPLPAPVTETKKDPEPPPSTTVITKPADPAPSPAAPTEPSVAIVPTSPGGAATLGPPGGAATPAPAAFSTANNSRPAAEPRAQSYLEEEYRWQPGDGFVQLSQRFYTSDKYAAALQQYNRDYPLAGPNLRRNPPSVAPGQVIWVPPVRILERDYPTLVAGVQPLTDRGMPATGRQTEAAVISGSPGATQLYRVRERGETMYEIARRTLGDSGKWLDVSRQNPTLSRDPRLPIPAGTVLRLPAEAKLEPADKPQ